MSIANDMENKILDAIFNAAGLTVTNTYVKLHTGDPGEAGTNNAAGETTRKLLSVGAASGGTVTSDADLTWTNVSTSETYTHVSVWDHLTAGNCVWVGALTVSKVVNAGDTFVIASGSLTISVD